MGAINPLLAGLGVSIFDPGARAVNNLRIASDVVSATKVTVGVDVYEIEIVDTDSTEVTAAADTFDTTADPLVLATYLDSYPDADVAVGGLLRVENEIMRCTGADGDARTFSRGASGTAVAAHADASTIYVGDGIAVGSTIAVGLVTTLTPAAFTTALTADINSQGAEQITATRISATEILLVADATGVVATACTETLAGANNVFANATMVGGRAMDQRRMAIQTRVPTATEVALDHLHVAFDFTPTILVVLVGPTATPGALKIWDGAWTISGGLVTIDNSGSVDFAATDTVTVIAIG